MAFTPNPTKDYRISLVAKSGNTIGYLNLSAQFARVVFRKDLEDVTYEDIQTVNMTTILENSTICLDKIDINPDKISAEDY